MDRHKELSIRYAEATSFSRSMKFNASKMRCFYDNLKDVLHKYKISANNIYNCDESGLTSVLAPPRIIS